MTLGVCAGGDTGSSGSADKMCCRELILATRLPVAGDWIGVGAGGRVRRLWADARVDHVPGRRLAWVSLVSGPKWELENDGWVAQEWVWGTVSCVARVWARTRS